MEELGQASKGYTFIILIGFFLSFAAVEMMWTTGINLFVKITFFLPITSIFVLPGAIIIGKVTLIEVFIAIIIEIIFGYIILRFVSLVYESVIVMNDGTVKFKQVLAIAKQNRKYVKANRKDGV